MRHIYHKDVMGLACLRHVYWKSVLFTLPQLHASHNVNRVQLKSEQFPDQQLPLHILQALIFYLCHKS